MNLVPKRVASFLPYTSEKVCILLSVKTGYFASFSSFRFIFFASFSSFGFIFSSNVIIGVYGLISIDVTRDRAFYVFPYVVSGFIDTVMSLTFLTYSTFDKPLTDF